MEFLNYSIIDGYKATMLLDKEVGEDEEGYGIDGSKFAFELMYLDSLNLESIEIQINSPGGLVIDGMSIYHAIRAAKTKIITKCIGLAASIAAVIFEGGDERVIVDYGILMFHNPYSNNPKSKSLANFKEAIMVMVSKSGMEEEKIKKMMDAETWINGNNEEYLGILWDSCEKTEKKKTSFRNEVELIMNFGQEIIDSIKNKNNEMDKSIKESLGLEITATNEDVLNAINSLKESVVNQTKTEGEPEKTEPEATEPEKTEPEKTEPVINQDFSVILDTLKDIQNQINDLKVEKEKEKIENKNVEGVDLNNKVNETPKCKTMDDYLWENIQKLKNKNNK